MDNRFEVKKVTDEGMPFYKVTDTQTGRWTEWGYRNAAEAAAVQWEQFPERVDNDALWYSPEPVEDQIQKMRDSIRGMGMSPLIVKALEEQLDAALEQARQEKK